MSRRFLCGRKVEHGKDAAVLLWFSDQRKQARTLDPSRVFFFEIDEKAERKAWETVREQVLTQWIASRPGSRPGAWWRYDSPRGLDDVPQQRRVLSGAGRPGCDESGFGLPLNWLGGFSSDNPPTFESESTFLKRHRLLSHEEESRCDFSPLTVSNERELTYHYGRYEIAGVGEDELIGEY